ncbi:hypothetical protein GUA87_13380 [Sneathiella sp. P13V-1]|uniref:RebB family R body protein n=1 Tax=Sneathiella sp. P13V-1 TaxID=2697366 RepID=UPI00187BAF98|nr:RebB family R body protein [Sneathiella sp. P13V-1]MBE7637842.1 hypothetical protein [Sneathiella sp. P13V-1]
MTKDDSNSYKQVKSVNSQITDAVTQSNMVLTGLAPAHSMGTLYQTMAHTVGTSWQNAVSNQQNVNTVNLAALAQNLQLILQPQQRRREIQLPPIIVQPTVVKTASQNRESDDDTSSRRSKSK